MLLLNLKKNLLNNFYKLLKKLKNNKKLLSLIRNLLLSKINKNILMKLFFYKIYFFLRNCLKFLFSLMKFFL